MSSGRNARLFVLAGLLLGLHPAPPMSPPQDTRAETREVRQIVTFKFLPGRAPEAVALFRDRVLPIYEATEAMHRFRGYWEVESPDPLDLVVISTFRGMAGMDVSNDEISRQARQSGTSIPELYGAISALSQHHRDEFVELLPQQKKHKDPSAARLMVLSYVRTTPGEAGRFESLLGRRIVPWENSLDSLRGAETARVLVAAGWDYLRILGFDSLGALHEYDVAERAQSWAPDLDRLVDASKRVVLRPEPTLAVR